MHIVRRIGELAAQPPFLGHLGSVRYSDRGIPCGVLTALPVVHLLRLIRAQVVGEDIKCPRCLLCATGERVNRLYQDPEEALPLCQLIFRNRDDDILPGSSQTMATIP